MNKKTVKSIMVVMILMVVALYFVSGTYARYIDKYTGNAKFEVAKWAVALKKDGTAVQEETFDLTFKPVDNEYVVSGKIAPDVEAVAEVEVDLTGTEVAVDLAATVDTGTLKSTLQEYGTVATDITVESKIVKVGDEQNPLETSLINLPSGAAFAENNGKYKIIITANWKNDEAHNEDDTKAGKAADTISELTVPVNIEAKQHIASDD